MNVVQSYVSTIGGGHMGLYECRIWMCIVERAQDIVSGQMACKYKYSADDVLPEHLQFELLASKVLQDGSKHYELVKDAIRSLSAHQIEHYESSSRTWMSSPLIYNSSIEVGTGLVKFCVAKWVYEYILTFSRGFCRYHLESAMRLKTSNCIILYMLTCNLEYPVLYDITILKAITGDSDKYTNNHDYIKRVIAAVSTELAKLGVNGYSYDIVKVGCKIRQVRIIPVKRQDLDKQTVLAQVPLGTVCDYGLKTYLVNQCGFSVKELGAHKDLLKRFGEVDGWQQRLLDIVERQRKKRAGKGYIINAIKSVLSEYFQF